MRLTLERAAQRFEIERVIKLHAEGVATIPADNAGRFLLARQHDSDVLAAHRGRPTRAGAKSDLGDVADYDVLHLAITVNKPRTDDAGLALRPGHLMFRDNGSHERH
ncbi:MAG: hypothetical protein CFE35_01535 [Novosphingobium sp. PASSN1]|nr:MAG: hypothetical protein CFE35_01535 [Novosphingobium sp. PASSN1]